MARHTTILRALLITAGFFVWLLAAGAPLAVAQFTSTTPDLSIEMIPNNPAPLAQVTLRATSYSADLNTATLTWLYNGKVQSAGVGLTTITVTAPRSGNVATITLRLSGTAVTPATTSIIINPGSVDLLWEAVDGYTPPFYKGRSQLAHGGTFHVVAIPGKNAPKQAVFEWSQNGSSLQNISGTGKSTALFENTMFNTTENIAVAVRGSVFSGSSALTIIPKTPEVVAYQKKEGFIDYANGVLDTIAILGPGAVLRFEPFFFSIPDTLSKNLSFHIRSGENESLGGDIPNEVAIARPDGAGESSISVIINTIQYSLQNITHVFTLHFQ